MDDHTAMTLAEKLNGTIRTHTGYAVPYEADIKLPTGRNRAVVPHIKGMSAAQLAKAVTQGQTPSLSDGGVTGKLSLPKQTAQVIAAINGRRSLQQICAQCGLDPFAFGAIWTQIETELTPWGFLVYSRVLL